MNNNRINGTVLNKVMKTKDSGMPYKMLGYKSLLAGNSISIINNIIPQTREIKVFRR